jgi:hypothetical protein
MFVPTYFYFRAADVLLTVDSSSPNYISVLYRPRRLFFLGNPKNHERAHLALPVLSPIFFAHVCLFSPPSNLNQLFSSLATTSIRAHLGRELHL